MLNEHIKQRLASAQKSEITEYLIYKRLSRLVKDANQQQILEKISEEELRHYDFFKSLTQEEVLPDRAKVYLYVLISRLLGLNFGLKLMESGENLAQDGYEELNGVSDRIRQIVNEENSHEAQLISLINEERLQYASSVVLGLNDALVELSGALVGFTLALQNARLVGIVGLITGIAASLSMAASEYLSTKHEETEKNPLKAAVYTGIAYILTVALLIFPYLIFENIYLCLSLVIFLALFVIFIFTFYISVAKGLNFRKRFLEMAGISLGIAAINYVFGLLIRKIFGIEI